MRYTNLIWRDGQPYSEMFDDIYYASNEGEDISGESEFKHVFFNNNGLPARWQTDDDFVIAELGFGSGLNCLLTIREWLKHLSETKQRKTLHYIAIEKYPLAPETIVELISRYPELKFYCDELVRNYPPAVETTHSRRLFSGSVVIHYKFMDVVDALEGEPLNVDAWYLDGFSPANNTAMWSEQVFLQLAKNSCTNSTCSTYTAAGYVKRNLISAGFSVSKVSGFGKKREMLVARYEKSEDKVYKFKDKPWFHLPIKPTIENNKAIIIGAGIAGLTSAFALIQRGWKVTIIETHGAIAKEASSNPVALVYPRLSVNNKTDTDFYVAAFCYALHALAKLQNKYTQQFWFDCGLLQLMDRERLSAIQENYQFSDEVMSISDIATDTTAVSDIEQVFVDIKNAGYVLPEVLCRTLVEECGDHLVVKRAEIDSIVQVDSRWRCFSGTQSIDEAEILIVANGVSLNKLHGLMTFPVESVRGQVISLRTKSLSDNVTRCQNTGVYLTPQIKGQHYLGASYTRANDSLVADSEDIERLLSKLRVHSSGVAGVPDFDKADVVDSWVGFRAMSQDRAPIVGAIPDVMFYEKEYEDIRHGNVIKKYEAAHHLGGLYITAAHGSRGFTSSFLSAEILAAQIHGEPLPVSKSICDYLSPSRFIVNELKRR